MDFFQKCQAMVCIQRKQFLSLRSWSKFLFSSGFVYLSLIGGPNLNFFSGIVYDQIVREICLTIFFGVVARASGALKVSVEVRSNVGKILYYVYTIRITL